jgi:pimeloyl-ACP methyl ester carboxylesterase
VQVFDISMKKVEAPTEVRRPQEPKPPFPYRIEDVTYRNEPGGVTLAGTLTLPKGDGPFPAALLITGSGGQNRDEELFQHKPFWVIADHLTRRGIAVLRVDDRGVGGSSAGPEPGKVTTFDFAGDVEAGIAFLRSRDDIARDKIGLIGHSEGGVIAPIVAARNPGVAYIVLLAGTGVRGAELLVMQGEALMQASGTDEAKIAADMETQRAIFDIVLDESLDPNEARARIRPLIKASPEYLEAPEDERETGMKAALDQLETPWVRTFVRYDPAPTLARVRCPVLAINGERDLQVPCRANLDAIAGALEKGGNPDFTIKAFPGLNHLFQHCETGQVSEYGQIEETFSVEVLDTIADWIAVRFLEN